jgi:hypothetical protein
MSVEELNPQAESERITTPDVQTAVTPESALPTDVRPPLVGDIAV